MQESGAKLVRTVGFWGLVAMCINAVVGSGVFRFWCSTVATVPGPRATSFDAALRLAHEAGVVTLPLPTFFAEEAAADNLVRLAFCKGHAALAAGAERLAGFGAAGGKR